MTEPQSQAPPSASDRTRQAQETRHLLTASAVVTGMGLLSKALGFLRGPVEAAVFGATRAMDAFNLARQIPLAFTTWFEGPVRAAMIPLFTRRMHEESEASAWQAASNIINSLAVALGLLCAVLYFAAEPLVRVIGAGFRDAEAWNLSARLAQILVLSIGFSVLAVILGSLQNIYKRQVFPALGRATNAAAILLAGLYLGPRYGLEGYALGFLGGAVLAFALQLGLIWRHRAYYRFSIRPRAPELRQLLLIAFPLFIGLAGTRIDAFLDFFFASYLPEGHLSVRIYGEILAMQFSDLVLVISHAVLLPHFAHLVAEERDDELRQRLVQAAGGYLIVGLPLAVLLVVGARPLVDLFFLHGNFTPEKARLTAILTPILAVSAPAYTIGQMFAQVHISAGDTKTPMKIGFIRIGFKLVLSLSLILPLGIIGLCIASSTATYLRTFLLWRKLPESRRPTTSELRPILFKLGGAALSGGVVAWVVLSYLPLPELGQWTLAARVVLAASAAFLVHYALAWSTGDRTARAIARRVAKTLGRRRGRGSKNDRTDR